MEGILEKWHWHVLYYNTWVDAYNAQQSIIREYDQYGLVRQRKQGYMVLFSTNYPFDNDCRVELYVTLLNIIPNDVPTSAYFNVYSSNRISVISGLVNISHVLIATAYEQIITYRLLIGIVLSVLLSSAAIGFCCYLLLHFLAWLDELNETDQADLEDNLAQQLGVIQWDHQRGEC